MKAQALPRRRRWLIATAALGAVFALKLFVLSQLIDHPLLQPDAGVDTAAYVALAKRVLGGDPGLGPGLYYVSPLYIYFLAVVYGLTDSFTAVHIVQIALGTLTVGLIFVMGREWGGTRAGVIAAGMASACGVLTFHEIVLMQSALDPFLTACALASLTYALRSGSRRWFFVCGACFGVQTLNRPQVLFAVLCIAVVMVCVRKMRPAALLAAGLVVAMLPVAIRNVVVAGQWSLVSSHGGLNFYIGNHAEATGLYTLVPGIRPDIEGQREDTRRVAEAAAGRPLSDAEVSDYFFERALGWVRSNPAAALQLFGKKLVLAVHGDHVALPHSFEFFAHDAKTFLRWLVVNPWIIMSLGLAGLFLARRDLTRDDVASFAIWATFVPAYAVSLAVFFLAERYRLPLIVPLCVSAGMLVDRMLRAAAGKTRLTGAQWAHTAAVIVACAIVVNWPFALADSREGDRLRMVHHAASRQDIAEAERWAALVIASSSSPADVEGRIGKILLEAGRAREAAHHLMNAAAHGRPDPSVRLDLAEADHLRGNGSAALATLQAIDWSGATPQMEQRGGRLAAALRDWDLAITLFKRATEREPHAADAWAQLGFAFLFSGRIAEAEPALEEAARLKPSDAAVLGGLAVCAARRGNTEEALERANAALAIDPADPLARQVRAAIGR